MRVFHLTDIRIDVVLMSLLLAAIFVAGLSTLKPVSANVASEPASPVAGNQTPEEHLQMSRAPTTSLEYPGDVTLGAEEVVFDYTTDRCETNDIPDVPARAFRDADGNVQLIAGHYVNYRSTSSTLAAVTRDCSTPVLTSHKDPDPQNYDYKEWIHSVYTEDGSTIYAFVHNEFHGHAATSTVSCPSGDAEDCWYNAITFASSTDKGKTYTHASSSAHLMASTPYLYTPDQGPMGVFNPSNIIKNASDGYYYPVFPR